MRGLMLRALHTLAFGDRHPRARTGGSTTITNATPRDARGSAHRHLHVSATEVEVVKATGARVQ
jgi:hypothetical protein